MDRIRDKKVTIRKPRKCFGCLSVMSKGDTAYTQTNSDDGRIYDLTVCVKCNTYIVRNLQSDDEFNEGELKDELK
jgi:hypothetical protein